MNRPTIVRIILFLSIAAVALIGFNMLRGKPVKAPDITPE